MSHVTYDTAKNICWALIRGVEAPEDVPHSFRATEPANTHGLHAEGEVGRWAVRVRRPPFSGDVRWRHVVGRFPYTTTSQLILFFLRCDGIAPVV